MKNGVVIGTTADGKDVALSYEQRRQHTYVIGVNGTGKTTLLGRIALHDMSHPERHGVCVIDPHGDLIDDLMDRIPSERANDVILLDPSKRDWPFAFNLFAQPLSASEVDLLASEIVGIFAKVFGTNWGPRIEDVTRNVAMTLLTRSRDFTLDGESYPAAMDEIPALLRLEKVKEGFEKKRYFDQEMVTYRSLFYAGLREAGHLPVEEFWVWDYDTLTPRPRAELVSSVLNKVRRFLTNPLMRNIVAQTESKLDLSSVMNEGKILLVKLSKGRLGDDNASFLGSLIVAKLAVAIFARAGVPRSERRPFHIVVDEFQNFATSTFPTLLTEARKYAVDLTIAHQYRDQLRHWVQGATSTAGNLICFRINGDDADELAREFDHSRHAPPFEVVPSFFRLWLMMQPGKGEIGDYDREPKDDDEEYARYHAEHLVRLARKDNAVTRGRDWKTTGADSIELRVRVTDHPSKEELAMISKLEAARRRFPRRIDARGWSRSDVHFLKRPEFGKYADAYRAAANALTQLPNYHATCRLLSSAGRHAEATFTSPDWDAIDESQLEPIQHVREVIEANTYDTYCREREDVEAELEQRYSQRLQAIGLPPLDADQALPEVDKLYEED